MEYNTTNFGFDENTSNRVNPDFDEEDDNRANFGFRRTNISRTNFNKDENRRAGFKVMFKGEQNNKAYLDKSLSRDYSGNWGLTRKQPYVVSEVFEDYQGNVIYGLAGIRGYFHADCFERV